MKKEIKKIDLNFQHSIKKYSYSHKSKHWAYMHRKKKNYSMLIIQKILEIITYLMVQMINSIKKKSF